VAKPVIRVDGLSETRKALREFGDAGLKKALTAANKDISKAVVNKAPNVPVGTRRYKGHTPGSLKRTVKALASQSSARAKAGSAKVGYAAAIHWGRKRRGRIIARPFLFKAAQSLEGKAQQEYVEAIDDILKRAGLR
jgi:phage gpG-like protein